MCSYVLMKLFESSAKRYDAAMNLLSLGLDRKIKMEIASKFVSKGEQVFEIGVGTGTLAILCAERGAFVTGIDISEKMLEVAKRKICETALKQRIILKNIDITMMDKHVPSGSFDKVLCTFVLSELSDEGQRFTLAQSYRILRPNGEIILLDEVVPDSLGKKVLYYLVRVPLKIIAYLFAQTTTSPLRGIEEKLSEAHFKIEFLFRYFFDSLQLIVASKEKVQ